MRGRLVKTGVKKNVMTERAGGEEGTRPHPGLPGGQNDPISCRQKFVMCVGVNSGPAVTARRPNLEMEFPSECLPSLSLFSPQL